MRFTDHFNISIFSFQHSFDDVFSHLRKSNQLDPGYLTNLRAKNAKQLKKETILRLDLSKTRLDLNLVENRNREELQRHVDQHKPAVLIHVNPQEPGIDLLGYVPMKTKRQLPNLDYLVVYVKMGLEIMPFTLSSSYQAVWFEVIDKESQLAYAISKFDFNH